jgi:hypothetical protein
MNVARLHWAADQTKFPYELTEGTYHDLEHQNSCFSIQFNDHWFYYCSSHEFKSVQHVCTQPDNYQ